MESQDLQYRALLEMNAVQTLYDQIEDFYAQYEEKKICTGQLHACIIPLHIEINKIFMTLTPLI